MLFRSENGVKGCKRFLDRVFKLPDIMNTDNGYTPSLEVAINQTIKKVTDDIPQLKFNTAIAALMKLLNSYIELGHVTKKDIETFITLLYPTAPHICEEINERIGNTTPICLGSWPKYDENKIREDTIEIPVTVNGKVKAKVSVDRDADEAAVVAAAVADEAYLRAVDGKTIVKTIYVPGKILNIVVK